MQERIVFLDYLRAFACLLVVFGHICFLGLNGYEAWSIFVPGVKANIFGPLSAENNVFTAPSIWLGNTLGIMVGPLGVAIFFVISGYLIARAVERDDTATFAAKRAVRIFPTLAAAAVFTLLITDTYCSFVGLTSPHSIESVTISIFMLNAFTGHIDAIPVLWTLRVEVVFYISMAVAARFGTITFNRLVIVSFACFVFLLLASLPQVHILPAKLASALRVLTLDASQIIFILVGSVIYRAGKTNSPFLGLLTGSLLFVLFVVGQEMIPLLQGHSLGGVDVRNGAWAIGLFCCALWSGMHWRWLRPMLFVADISYPLYVIHVPFAWILLTMFGSMGWSMLPAAIATWILVILVAWGLHMLVEKPSLSFIRNGLRTRSTETR